MFNRISANLLEPGENPRGGLGLGGNISDASCVLPFEFEIANGTFVADADA